MENREKRPLSEVGREGRKLVELTHNMAELGNF
jgi:hypothetical protein